MGKNIIGIDRGSKIIGLAYIVYGHKIPLPIGYLQNNSQCIFSLADIIIRYNIGKIIIGYPIRQKNIQIKIDKFIYSLGLVIDENISFEKIDEDYTSIQAGDIISNFKKNVAEDTISAMIILQRWIELE